MEGSSIRRERYHHQLHHHHALHLSLQHPQSHRGRLGEHQQPHQHQPARPSSLLDADTPPSSSSDSTTPEHVVTPPARGASADGERGNLELEPHGHEDRFTRSVVHGRGLDGLDEKMAGIADVDVGADTHCALSGWLHLEEAGYSRLTVERRSKGLAREVERGIKMKRMGLERALTWSAEVKSLAGGAAGDKETTHPASHGGRPAFKRSRTQVGGLNVGGGGGGGAATTIQGNNATTTPRPAASHPYRLAPLRPPLSRSTSQSSNGSAKSASREVDALSSVVGGGKVPGPLTPTSSAAGKARRRDKPVPSSGEIAGVRFVERPQRPIRSGSWHRRQNAGTSRLEIVDRSKQDEDDQDEDEDALARFATATAVATVTDVESRTHRRCSLLDDPSEKAAQEQGDRIVETLWREGRCTGREGNVRCEMTKEEYIVQVDGLVPSPYATSLYLSGCRCLKINGEQAAGAEEFHETVDFPENAVMNAMEAKWSQGKLVVHVPKKQEREEVVDTDPKTEGTTPPSLPRTGSKGFSRVASAGDVPLTQSRRTGIVALEDVEL